MPCCVYYIPPHVAATPDRGSSFTSVALARRVSQDEWRGVGEHLSSFDRSSSAVSYYGFEAGATVTGREILVSLFK